MKIYKLIQQSEQTIVEGVSALFHLLKELLPLFIIKHLYLQPLLHFEFEFLKIRILAYTNIMIYISSRQFALIIFEGVLALYTLNISSNSRDDFFFSYLTDVSYFLLNFRPRMLQDTVRSSQKWTF